MENDVSVAADEAYAGILSEFLEVAIHLILYVREIYPPGLFQRRRKYNVPVHICAHPELNQYIRRVVDDIRPLLEAGQVDHITVLIKNKQSVPVERFVFETGKGSAKDICSKRFFAELERDLRNLLLKISVTDPLLKANPPDCTFTVEVCTSEAAAAATVGTEQGHQDFPWVVEGAVGGEMEDASGWNLVPLKSISNDLIKVSVLRFVNHL